MRASIKTASPRLCGGLFLQHFGVPFVLVEKNRVLSPLPRARGLHGRTRELFRQVGVEDEVKAAAASAWMQGGFGGAHRGPTLVEAQPIADVAALRGALLPREDHSPSNFAACPQTLIEQILLQQLVIRGGDVRFGHELVSSADEGNGVRADLRDPDGAPFEIEASWLIGADGGRSRVREQSGIEATATPASQHFVNIFFHADLSRVVEGRTFSQCEIENGKVRGLFLAMNNTDKLGLRQECPMTCLGSRAPSP